MKRGRDWGLGAGDIRLLSNPGLQHLAMVLHALDVLSERRSIGHGDIDVPFTEDPVAGHFESFVDSIRGKKKKKKKRKRTEECDFGKCWQIVECCSYAIVKSLLGEEEKKGGVQKSEGGGQSPFL